MKGKWILTIFIALLIGGLCVRVTSVFAFDSGSTGALGAFNPTTSTEVQLPADGKLNYTTVNIPSGVTVTFKRNAANTPVYILATGDVTITGTISINGGNASSVTPGVGGPGGYDGGYGGILGTYGSSGMGPLGGAAGTSWTFNGSYGTYLGSSGGGGSITTNDRIIPSVGGSGGGGGAGGHTYNSGFGGGGGGGAGALLIASSTKVTINGAISANGGNSAAPSGYGGAGGGGSAGTIRIVTNELAGNGAVQATAGSTGGANGKVRFEFNITSRTANTTPVNIFTTDYPGPVFGIAMPLLKITFVGGINVPDNPSASYANTDITLPENITNPVAVTVSASNIPAGTTVTVKAVPQYETVAAATASAILAGTDQASSASTTITLSAKRPSILIATATFNVTVASNGTPLYAEGEKVARIKVDTQLNGGSSVTYITESGREVLAMNSRRF